MKIAYIPQNSPYDKNSWSGTDYYTRISLEKQGNEVYCIYGFHPKESLCWKIKKFIFKLFHKDVVFKRTFNASKQWAKYISNKLETDTDAILSLGTLQIASLETKIPIFIYVDGIFEQMRIDYRWTRLSNSSIKEANALEQKALDRCACIISCAIKTKEAILKNYRIDKEKIEIVPLGANWDKSPSYDSIINSINNRSATKCKLLFVGVDWERKGADIVLDTAKILIERGMNIEVHLCGIKKIPIHLPDYVHNHGFLNKSRKKDLVLLDKLFSDSHFLFVPSRAEAYGLVFCEASAYGLPSISHKIGGLTTTVVDGINGKLFDLGTKPSVFAEYIFNMFSNQKLYKSLCMSSLQRYKSYLNWDVSGKKLNDIIKTKLK